jgi:hypothetical protein
MKKSFALLLSLFVAVMLASCGGGGGGGGAPSQGSTGTTTPWIRYAGTWHGSPVDSTKPPQPVTLMLSALSGQGSISANPVASVAVQLGSAAPVVMTAPNSTDASGHPQYVFNFGQLAEAPNCTNAFPTLPVAITVTDSTGFAYTKHVATCVATAQVDFGAFSDYGTTAAQFSYQSTAPITAFATRSSPTGYVDELVPAAQSTFSGSLPSSDGDMLMLMTNPNVPLATGTVVTTRIDGGGGSFAESSVVATDASAPNADSPFVTLQCCGPRPAAGSSVAVTLRTHAVAGGIAYPPDATYTYKFTITDPATGATTGSQSDTIIGDASFPLNVQRGQAIDMTVTPNDPRISVSASAQLAAPSAGDSVQVTTNQPGVPARFKVYCCSP